MTFTPKTISWAKFTVNQAAGKNTGLSEIEVYGRPASSTANYAPQISRGPVASPGVVNSSDSSNLSLSAYDVNGDALQYSWTADSGSIAGNGSTATFFPPASPSEPVFTITATVSDGKGGTLSNSAFVSANAPGALTLNPATVTGGSPSQGTVTLLAAAPNAGAVVDLSSSDISIATVPSSVTVPANSTSATFTVNTTSVTATTPVTISGSYNGQTQSATLTVSRIVPSLTLNPTTVAGGGSSQGTVTLSAAAPSMGAVVSLSSSNPSVAAVPASVTIPAGSTSQTFTVTTSSVAAPTSVTLSASYSGSTATTTLTVDPQAAPGSNVALMASVTDSSENAAQGQQGIKAIDGVIDGYPGDYTKEWATLGQLAGAWIQLKWSSPVSVSKVILYDRPNLTDNVKSGTLLFSDGTSLSVGQLPNDAKTGYTVTFATKTISWVKFTVGSAVGQNIGLAEFQVIAAGP